MTIEEFVIGKLAAALSSGAAVPVSGSVPHPLPEIFVTVEKTGGSTADRIPTDTLAVHSYSTSRASAAELSGLVKAAMAGLAAEPEIASVALVREFNYTDEINKKPRYRAVFDVVHYIF